MSDAVAAALARVEVAFNSNPNLTPSEFINLLKGELADLSGGL